MAWFILTFHHSSPLHYIVVVVCIHSTCPNVVLFSVIIRSDQMEGNEMGRAFGTRGGEGRCVQGFGGKK